MKSRSLFCSAVALLSLSMLLAGCAGSAVAPTATAVPPTATALPPTVTPVPPTATPAPLPPTATPIPPTPTLTPLPAPTPVAQLSISSIPDGSEVFVASVADLGLELAEEAEKLEAKALLGVHRLKGFDAGFRAFSSVVAPQFRRGVAPLSLPLDPGVYIVFLSVPESVEVPDDTDILDWFQSDSANGPSISGFSAGHTGTTLVVEVDEPDDFLIKLWQPRDASLAEIEALYPPSETFAIDETDIRAKLESVVPEDNIDTVLRLLRKGAKAVYRPDDNHYLIMEIDPRTGSLDTFLQYEE